MEAEIFSLYGLVNLIIIEKEGHLALVGADLEGMGFLTAAVQALVFVKGVVAGGVGIEVNITDIF